MPVPVSNIDKIKEISAKLGVILKEFGGLESNVPHTNEYWALKAELNGLPRIAS